MRTEHHHRIALALTILAGLAVTGAADAQSPDLTLADALTRALNQNPHLSAFGLARRIADAEALQAALGPNPELALEVENFAGSGAFGGFDAAEMTLSLAQVFELGGKRGKRAELARFGSTQAEWDYESARLDVLHQVTEAFVVLLAHQQRLELAGEGVELARQDLDAVSRRVDAGAASPVELSRARVALATATLDRKATRHAVAAARARLAATWGGEETFGKAAGDLESVAAPPSLEQLQERLQANPDLARWSTALQQRQAALALQRANGTVDLTAEAGLRYLGEDGDRALVLGLSVPLPVRDRNQGGIAAATETLSQARDQQRADALSLATELVTRHEELLSSFEEIGALQQEIIPEAWRAMEAAENAYLKGLFSFTDVLAVRRTHFELRDRYFTALARYHLAVAGIERLVAGSLIENQEQE